MTTVQFNDLRRSWLATSPEVASAALRVLQSGWYIHGAEHEAFEHELAAYLEVSGVLGVANGTEALQLALRGVGCESGSVVVTAANAGGYTTTAAALIGARLVYADVDEDSLVLTPDSVAAVLDNDVRAVVVTHLYGNVADVEAITTICRARNIAVVEDCAQAIGATLNGRRVGSFGDAAAFSFYPTKNLGAAGDGGAVASNRTDVLERIRILRQYGWTRRYSIEVPGGMNSRLDELQAAILRTGLPHLDAMNERRRRVVSRYAEAVNGTALRMITRHDGDAVAHLAVAMAPSEAARDRARVEMSRLGVQTEIHYPTADHLQPGTASPARTTALPITEHATGTIFSLPCYPELTDEEVELVCVALAKVGGLLS